MNYCYFKTACTRCKRKILIGLIVAGAAPIVGQHATCASCIQMNDEFRKERPEAAKDIETWLASEPENNEHADAGRSPAATT